MSPDLLREKCEAFLLQSLPADHAHDISHVRRVVKNTTYLTDITEANPDVTLPAAWLHDCVSVAKDSPLRAQSSRLAADRAIVFLREIDYPDRHLEAIHHAIEAHSYSAGIPCSSLEARVVQDADRLDSLGAIGVARCFLVGGKLDRPMFDSEDPFCERRPPDDSLFTLDHFYSKLFKLPGTMQTDAGRREAERRAELMNEFLDRLKQEIVLEERSQ